MHRIWAPWRIGFILKGENKGDCFLCKYPGEKDDEKHLILHRGAKNFIILNAYPYNTGHLLVAPYRHLGDIGDMTEEEAKEHFDLIKLSVRLLTEVMKPTGYNTGMNLGRVAGAGIADHIHTHVVPRWQGDSNFMPIVADTKVLPETLPMTYGKLKEGLTNLK
jgi:ATP adenylyltransferase